jgi:hypothetical protein
MEDTIMKKRRKGHEHAQTKVKSDVDFVEISGLKRLV